MISRTSCAAMLTLLLISSVTRCLGDEIGYSWSPGDKRIYSVEIQYTSEGQTHSTKKEFTVTAAAYQAPADNVRRLNGNAFPISADGYLLSCAHLLDGVETVDLLVQDKPHLAKVVYTDQNTDLALLKVSNGQLRPLTLSGLGTVQFGVSTMVIGYSSPDGGEPTIGLSRGLVSQIKNSGAASYVRIDAEVNASHDGSPVFNDAGQVIAVANSKMVTPGSKDLGYIVPIKHILQFLGQAKSDAGIEVEIAPTSAPSDTSVSEIAQLAMHSVGRLSGEATRVPPDAVVLYFNESGVPYRPGRSRYSSRYGTGPVSGEAVVDRLGRVYSQTFRSTLSYSLGTPTDWFVPPLTTKANTQMLDRSTVKLFRTRSALGGSAHTNDWGSLIVGGQVTSSGMQVDATQTVSYTLESIDENTLQMTRGSTLSAEASNKYARYTSNSSGKAIFDRSLGLLRSQDSKYTLTQDLENVSVRLPISIRVSLIDQEIIDQRMQALAAAEAQRKAAAQAILDAESAMPPAERVNYFLSKLAADPRGGSSKEWLEKLAKTEPVESLRETVVTSMLSKALDPDFWYAGEAASVLLTWATKKHTEPLLALTKLTGHRANAVKSAALRALAAIGDQRALPIALECIHETWTKEAAMAVISRFAEHAQEPLLESVKNETDIWRRKATFEALAAVGNRETLLTLQSMKESDRRRQSDILHAAGKIESRLMAEAAKAAAPVSASQASATQPTLATLRTIVRELRAAKSVSERITSLERLSSLPVNSQYQTAIEKELHKYLSSEHRPLWPVVTKALGPWGSDASVPVLQEILAENKGDETLTPLVASCLQNIDSRKASLLLLELLKSGDENAQLQSAAALRIVGNHVEAELKSAFADASEEVQYQIVSILRSAKISIEMHEATEMARASKSPRVRSAMMRATLELRPRR